MDSQQSDNKFALVRTDDSNLDVTRIARLLAGALDLSAMDSLQLLSQRPGILVENVPEETANRCAMLVAETGVRARVVPQSTIVEVPEIVTLRSGRLEDDGFSYVVDDRRNGVVKWPDVLWVDFVTIQQFQKQGFADVEVDEGEPLESKHPLPTRFRLFLDLVTYEPWLLLRISDERFEFAATGVPTFAARRDNVIALCAAIAQRATKAHLGPGLKWLDSGGPRQPHRVASHAVYSGFLRWQLTRLFLA
jgi:hypothetical protein